MRYVLFFGSALFVAILFGTASAWLAVGRGMLGGIRIGPWCHYPHYGSASANPYVRARTQLAGPLALDRSEAIYFIADRDQMGRPLQRTATYRIEGRDSDARWWSITAYGADHHLMANPQNRYSYNSANLARGMSGNYIIYLSDTPKEGNWIPTGGSGTLELFLRLYNPAPAVLSEPHNVDLPSIIREEPADE